MIEIARQIADELGIPLSAAMQWLQQREPALRQAANAGAMMTPAPGVEALEGMAAATGGSFGDMEYLTRMAQDVKRGTPLPLAMDQDTVLPTTDEVGRMLGGNPDDPLFQAGSFFGFDLAGPAGKALGFLSAAAPAAVRMSTKAAGKTIRGGIPVEDALIVQHNMTPENVLHAERMGGMPMPSIGITKASQPIGGYGDVTLLGGQHMARPTARNPVYSADAYTPTYPSINYTLSDADGDKLAEFALEPFGVSRKDYAATRELPVSVYGLVDSLEDAGIRGWENNPALQARFLWEKGELDSLPNIRKGQQPENYYERREVFRERMESARQADDLDAWKDAKDQLDALDREAHLAQDPLKDILYEKLKYGSDLRNDYEKWVGEIPGRLNLDVKERIFAGYTPSGNRRYKEHTLDNVVSEMKKDMKDNNQTSMFGSGALRAQVAPRFRNITDVKDARSRIRPPEELDAIKGDLNDRLVDISSEIGRYAKHKTENPFIHGDRVRDQLLEITQGRASWGEYFPRVPDDLKSQWGLYIDELKNAPTAYFEAKPQRAVGLGEFSDALVPENAPDDIVEILARHGLNVERYTDDADRARRMMAKENLLFQHPAATILGGSLAAALLAGYPTDEV